MKKHASLHARFALPVLTGDAAFALCCSLLFAAITLVLPPYFPLIEPDSRSYIHFAASRTAIYPLFLRICTGVGLTLDQILYVQVALFSLCFAILIGALLRFGVRRRWIALFALLLAGNTYFSSFQRTILSESLSFSVLAVATAFQLDYFRTGRARFLALAGLFFGLNVGIRPSGLMILPMLPIAALLMRKQRDVSMTVLLLASVVPVAVGWLPERGLYILEHGSRSETIAPYLLSGKAAMLMRPDIKFTGPHATALQELGDKLEKTYAPIHAFLSGMPSLAARPVLTSFYESVAQFQVIDRDLVRLANQHNTTPEVLRSELGRQVIAARPGAFLCLTLIHFVGQWTITPLTFPPTVAALNAYRDRAAVPFSELMPAAWFTHARDLKSLFVFPAFILAGIVTLTLAGSLPSHLIWPPGIDMSRRKDLMIAAFFAGACHVTMLLTSLTNVSTPRFLMMVYPLILLSALFLLRAVRPLWIASKC